MATIDDIGVPGQPMNSPPLTPWQAAVRDKVKAHDRAIGGAKICGGQAGIVAGTAAITFPAGLYTTVPPTVTLGVTPGSNYFASVGNITITGATVYLTNKDGVTPSPSGFVNWIALGYS